MPKIVPVEEFDKIVALIAPHRGGVRISAVRSGLGSELSERALQRRLARLAAEGRIVSMGSGKGKRYFPPTPQVTTEKRLRVASAGVGRVKGRGNDERPLIFLSLLDRELLESVLRLAHEWEWELRGTWISEDEWRLDRPIAGALITELPTDPLAERLQEIGCPSIRIGARPHPDDDVLPAVLPDQATAGRLAAEHFASRRFRSVAYVAYDPEDPGANTHAVYIAFRQRADELGMACHLLSLVEFGGQDELERQHRRARGLATWVSGLPKPVGVFCFNDIMGERVGLACARAGLCIPEDVAVLGHGNTLMCEITPVRLSSVDPDNNKRAEVAMLLLRQMMGGEAGPGEPIMVPPAGIVVRESTDVLASKDPAVARAIRYLWDHLEDNLLSVDDVTDYVATPRRTLERAFHDQIGHGIYAELQRRRLETCCELLTTTDLSVTDIAPRIGFRSKEYLHKLFRATYGTTPRNYRLASAT